MGGRLARLPLEDATKRPRLSDADGAPARLGALASDREILMLGRRAFERGDDEVAREQFDRLVAHGARFADVQYMLGMLAASEAGISSALERLREAVRLNLSYVEALLALASLHERRGEYARSQGYAERASEVNSADRPRAVSIRPRAASSPTSRRRSLMRSPRPASGARRSSSTAARSSGARPSTTSATASASRSAKPVCPPRRRPSFSASWRPHSLLDSQVQLGLTWHAMGRTADAVAEWEAVLEKDPSRDEARMYLRLVRGAPSKGGGGPRREPTRPAAPKEADAEIAFRAVESPRPRGARRRLEDHPPPDQTNRDDEARQSEP